MSRSISRVHPTVPDRSSAGARRLVGDAPARRGVAPTVPAPGLSEPSPPSPAPRLKMLRFPAIRECTGLSRSTVWRLERRGDFPRHRRLSTNVVAWVEEEVMTWLRTRIDRGAA